MVGIGHGPKARVFSDLTQSLPLRNISPISFLAHLPKVLSPQNHNQKDEGCSHWKKRSADEGVLYAKLGDPGCDTISFMWVRTLQQNQGHEFDQKSLKQGGKAR